VTEDEPRPDDEPEPPDGEPETTSTFIGTIYMPVNYDADAAAAVWNNQRANMQEADRLRAEQERKRTELLDWQHAEMRKRHADLDDTIGRPLEPLVLEDVLEAERQLRERAALPKPPRSGPLTYSAIAARTNLSRDRLHEFEDLIRLGWPLSESHPDRRLRKSRDDFPADKHPVWLPTPRQARHLLSSG
jgi:hypothetical protein